MTLIEPSASVWTERELAAWSPLERITVSACAAKYRRLCGPNDPEPGPWHSDRVPYLNEIMDCVLDPTIEEIIVLKAAQVGYTECLLNLLLYWATQDPGSTMLVAPNRRDGEKIFQERIIPMLRGTPATAELLPDKKQKIRKDSIELATMSIYLGWAGSASSLASRSVKNLALDEIDKFDDPSGREADPIRLAKERTANYMHKRRVLFGCTPTTPEGNIYRAWQSCKLRLHYYVPCPHCGAYQKLVLPQIKWIIPAELKDDKSAAADYVSITPQAAHYECVECNGVIEDKHKHAMLVAGKWISENQTIAKDGTINGERPKSKRIAFQISRFYSPWTKWSDIAAEFIRSQGDLSGMQNFKNSWEAEPFFETTKTRTADDIRQHARKSGAGAAPGVIPNWTHYLLSAADVQGMMFYYATFAFGADRKMQLIHQGICATYEELRRATLDMDFPCESGGYRKPTALFIDSGGTGSRPVETYQFAAKDKGRVVAVKGSSRRMNPPFRTGKAKDYPTVNLAMIDTNYYKDVLDYAINDERLILHSATPDDYYSHLAAEHKIAVRKDGRTVFEWKPKSESIANHYLDVTVYALAGADIMSSIYGPIPPEAQIVQAAQQKSQQQKQANQYAQPMRQSAGGLSGITNIQSKW